MKMMEKVAKYHELVSHAYSDIYVKAHKAKFNGEKFQI